MFLRSYFFFRNNYNSSKHTIITGPTMHKHLLQIFVFNHVCGLSKLGQLVFFIFICLIHASFQVWHCRNALLSNSTFSLLAQHKKKKNEYKYKAVQTQTLVLKHLHCSFSKNGRVEQTIGNMNYSVCKSGLDNPF